jgi:Mlc titration factor MtfA (ptsG expression regulator)
METKVYIFAGFAILYFFIKALIRNDFSLVFKNECDKLFDEGKVPNLRKVLRDNFIVYKLLGEKERQFFEKRVWKFIKMKDFRSGSNIREITDEMRVMVAASAIQITYGYPEVYFSHFQTIILFAEEYYSAISREYHEGEVNAGGAIVLSWKNFMSGFSNPTDGRNLALHEMAHALRLENIVDNDEYDFIDRDMMQSFESLARIEMQKIEDGENNFFRSYGSVNLQEFFSVAVECFFEIPKEFKTYNPELYILLSRILKIDLLDFRKG